MDSQQISKKTDKLGRLTEVEIAQADGSRILKSVEYIEKDQPSRVEKYKISRIFPDGTQEYAIYDGFGNILEDGKWLDGVLSQKREFVLDRKKQKYDVTLYAHGGAENPRPVNHTTLRRDEIDRLDLTREFDEFLAVKKPIEEVEDEAEARGFRSPAELYRSRSESVRPDEDEHIETKRMIY